MTRYRVFKYRNDYRWAVFMIVDQKEPIHIWSYATWQEAFHCAHELAYSVQH